MSGSPHRVVNWLKNDAMAKSIKSGFCSQHLPYSMQVLCSWNLCNQPNHGTSFKSLKLGFAMGSLAEKLIHFVAERSIHEFFLNYLPVWILLQFAKGAWSCTYIVLLKINFPNLKFRSYWLSYFFLPNLFFFTPLFCPISSYILFYFI